MRAVTLGPFDLSGMLSGEAGAQPGRARPTHEGQIARLREAAERFSPRRGIEPFPFKVGDLVTPRKDSPLINAGEPHLVVEVNPNALPDFGNASYGDIAWGMRPQIRCISIVHGNRTEEALAAFWEEASYFQPYVGPAGDAA